MLGDDEFSAHAVPDTFHIPYRDRHGLHRTPRKSFAEMYAPSHIEPAIRGAQRRDRHAVRSEKLGPGGVGPELGPAAPAQNKHDHVCMRYPRPRRDREAQSARTVESAPSMSDVELHPRSAQAM